MGCGALSKIDVSELELESQQASIVTRMKGSSIKITNEKCPRIHLDVINKTRTLHIEGDTLKFDLEYCYVSQRGFYPRELDKPNQDSYLIYENIGDDTSAHLFGIFGIITHYNLEHTQLELISYFSMN